MDFRLLQESALSQAADLWDYCFEKKGTPFYEWYFREYALKQNRILGGFQDGKLRTMLHLNPYVLRVRGRDWKVPYIVGVATDPVARGHHVMGQLMDTAFTMLRAMKVPFVILMPIYAGIYQPYGYAWTHLRKHYTLPLAGLDLAGRTLDGYEPERVDTAKARELVAPVYARSMERYHGYAVRDQRVWDNLLITAAQENFETVILRNDGAPKAYALYNREGDKVTVQELAAVDPPAKIRLLQYFKGLAGIHKTLDWLAPEDDLTWTQMPDQALAPKEAPFMMGRVINAAACLKALAVPEDLLGKTLVLALKDEQIALNTMLVKLEFTREGIRLLNTLDDPEVLLDAGTFTQLFFGFMGPAQLQQAGMIYVDSKNALEILDKLFPRENNFINEYF